MTAVIDAQILIVGAGPVGLTLAIDLAQRGVDVAIVEIRHAGELPSVKCNQVSARSMEIYRRLGLAKRVRESGLPADYPNDVACRTTATGIELSRIPIPARAERYTSKEGPDTWWPTPEPTHRINQTFLEPILFAYAASHPRIRIFNRTTVESFMQDEFGVTAVARNLDRDEHLRFKANYLVGCDGARSTVRKAIGATLAGTPVVQRVQSTHIRAPDLMNLMPGKPAWLYLAFNPRRCGSMIAIDGRENWIIHNFLYNGEEGYEFVDRDWAIRAILGVGEDFKYEVVSKEDWIGRRLVADKFRDRRAFICGDAAHIWIPHAAYGMNAGIADAASLAWMLAATLQGWAAPDMLDAYGAERQPITEQVSRFVTDASSKISKQRREIPVEIERPGPEGDAARARVGKEAYDLYVQQQCCGGFNFGYFYDVSPIIAYDGEPHPAYDMHTFANSSVPGCRAPHVWLEGPRSLYDALGPGYTLIRLDPVVPVSGLTEAAARRGVPLAVLDLDASEARAVYGRKLVLVRPDRHVAWRGDEEPAAPLELIDVVRGAGAASSQRRSAA